MECTSNGVLSNHLYLINYEIIITVLFTLYIRCFCFDVHVGLFGLVISVVCFCIL